MFKYSPTSSSFFHHIHPRKMRTINRFFFVFGRNFRPSISLSNHYDSHQQPLILNFLILTSIFFTRTTLSAIIVGDSSSDYSLTKNLSIINLTSSSSSTFIHNNDKPNLELNQDRSHGHSTTTMFDDKTDENLANQDRSSIYSDQFVAQISGGPEHAQSLAAHHGFIYLGQIFDDYYHLMHKKVSKRFVDKFNSTSDIKAAFEQHPSVISFNQEKLNHRTKRDFVVHHPNRFQSIPYFASNNLRASQENKLPLLPFPFDHNDYVQCGKRVKFDDPQWPRMWYLNRGNDLDMDVVEAWEKNYTGRGVVVTILDDGLEKDHPDLFTNYDPEASFDVNGFDNDPMPRYDIIDSNRHGTRCAGEVAANANNSVCAVGIAFNAKVGGIRMLDGDVTDAVEARSLGFNPQHIHIYSASWGPDDDGRTVDGPGKMAVRAFENGIRNGREGKGSIFVWASGNGGREKDNCNCDGYTNSIWTLSISSATEKGSIPWYSEACSATLASTYSSGSFGERQIVTTDLHHGCTSSHTGTSASAPLAAGICALALEANLNLTWRDMQHIVVLSAKRKNLEGNWMENGAGLNVSHWFGYGLINASAMVDYSRNWITVPEQRKCIFHGKLNQSSKRKNSLVSVLNVSCNELKYMEHVQVVVNLTTPKRGDIEIEIISPSGTRSTLLTKRPKDSSPQGFNNWPFMTVHFWGESPNGLWTLMINNTGRQNNTVLAGWNIVMHGTKEYPFKDSYYPKRNRQDYIIGEEKPTTAINDLNHNQIDTNQPTNSNKKPINYFPSPNGRNLDDDHRDDEFNGNELEMNMHSPRQHSSSYASNKINKLLPHETYRTSMESSSSRLSLRIELYYFTLLLSCTVLYSLVFFG